MMTFKAINKVMKDPLVRKVVNTIKKPIAKAIGNTVNNSMGIFQRQKSNVKNLSCRIGDFCFKTKNSIGSSSVGYLRNEGIKKFKSIRPWAARGGEQLVKKGSKTNIYTRSANYLKGKGERFGPLIVKRSIEQARGKELNSFINMVSKSKPYLPFITGAGIIKLTTASLVPPTYSQVVHDVEHSDLRDRKAQPFDDFKGSVDKDRDLYYEKEMNAKAIKKESYFLPNQKRVKIPLPGLISIRNVE